MTAAKFDDRFTRVVTTMAEYALALHADGSTHLARMFSDVVWFRFRMLRAGVEGSRVEQLGFALAWCRGRMPIAMKRLGWSLSDLDLDAAPAIRVQYADLPPAREFVPHHPHLLAIRVDPATGRRHYEFAPFTGHEPEPVAPPEPAAADPGSDLVEAMREGHQRGERKAEFAAARQEWAAARYRRIVCSQAQVAATSWARTQAAVAAVDTACATLRQLPDDATGATRDTAAAEVQLRQDHARAAAWDWAHDSAELHAADASARAELGLDVTAGAAERLLAGLGVTDAGAWRLDIVGAGLDADAARAIEDRINHAPPRD